MTKQYTVSRTIDASPEAVWALLTDADGYRNWNEAVLSLDGPITVGNKIKLVSIVNPKRTFSLEVAQMDQPRKMVWQDGMPLGLFKGVRTFELELRGSSTEFSMTEVYSGVLAPLITKAIPDLTDSFTLFADGLKQAAEAGS